VNQPVRITVVDNFGSKHYFMCKVSMPLTFHSARSAATCHTHSARQTDRRHCFMCV